MRATLLRGPTDTPTLFKCGSALCALLLVGLNPVQAEHVDHVDSAEKPRDLTGMSLEDLLSEDIVPINVLASHTHLAGEFMVGYRYMFMEMGHNQDGTRDVSVQEVLENYPVAHSRMETQMHMLDFMYAPADWVTVMAMLPYKMNYMHHVLRTGPGPTDYTAGISDVTFMSSFNVLGDPRGHGQRLILNAGFTAPGVHRRSGGWQALRIPDAVGLRHLGPPAGSDLPWACSKVGLGSPSFIHCPFGQERQRLSAWGRLSAQCLDPMGSHRLAWTLCSPGLAWLGQCSRG